MQIFHSDNYDLICNKINEFKQQKYEIIDGTALSINDLLNFSQQLSIFDDGNTKVFINCIFQKDDHEKIKELLKLSNIIVFYNHSKKIHSFLEPHTTKLTTPSLISYKTFIENEIKKTNAKFESEETRDYFINSLKSNPILFKNELTKLINFASNSIITKEQIDILISSLDEQNIFDLVKFIFINPKRALKIIDSLILNKFTIIEILSIISPQLINFKLIAQAKNLKMSDMKIQKELGMPI
jgi:DNA polymerase III delta subunit